MYLPLALTLCLVHAQPTGASTTQRPPVSESQQARAREIYLPSAAHEELKRLVGTWEQTTEYPSPSGAVRTHGTVVNRSVLEGRFVVSEAAARQKDGALRTESLLIFGFDGRNRSYTVIVLDTFGTYYVTAAGEAQTPSQRLVMSGETPEGKGIKRFDVTLEWLDNNAYETRVIFHLPGRPPVMAFVSTHRRVGTATGDGR